MNLTKDITLNLPPGRKNAIIAGCEQFIKEKIKSLNTTNPTTSQERADIGVVYFYTFLKT
jgi:hypothetical protein